MFTGLVQAPRPIAAIERRTDAGLDLWIDLGESCAGIALGESIAVAGACLTVARLEGTRALFELSPETLARTRFSKLTIPGRLNIEKALRAGDRLGGHWVQGHVDGIGAVRRLARAGEWAEIDVALPAALARYCVEKGSICIDGVSLTIARMDIFDDGGALITIALIPHTLERTTLCECAPGGEVHVEVDILAKYVEALVAPYRGK